MRTFASIFGLVPLAVVAGLAGCGPDGSANGNQNQADAFVFADSRPRPDAAPCEDRCTVGQRQCVTGGFQECGNYDSDTCTEWGPVVACNPGEKCTDGTCGATCTNECTEGSVKCSQSGEGVQACEENGANGCWFWGEQTPCPFEQTCTGGVCSAECVDECTQDSRQCSGDGYQVCDNFDADDCLDWGPVTSCGTGETCSNGVCGTGCTNECVAGSKQCASTSGTQACGDFDSDACLEWGPVTPCALGETCSNGICDVDTNCEDECDTLDAQQCTASGTGYQVCGDTDPDACFEWGPAVSCTTGQTCRSGACEDVCGCNFYPGICEVEAPNSTTDCACDDDCLTEYACDADGHCDTWCPAGTDPDCECACNYNEYCEAALNYNTNPLPGSGFEDTCACDPDCEVNEYACMDDGHCDTWCQAAHDPDCGGVNECRDRFMLVGERYGDELMLYGEYEDPDPTPDFGYGWVYLSPDLSTGSAEIFTEFAAENLACVDSLVVEAYGVDDSYFGDGAEMYLFNWDTFQFDLLSDSTLWRPEGYFDNFVFDVLPYLSCGTGAGAKCYVNAKINASAWDAAHLLWVGIYVHTSP